MTEKTEQFVPKFYKMDPETEDLLPNGRYLANGMVVLIAHSDSRSKISEDQLQQDWQIDRALESNRWATVTHFETIGNTVKFIGVYEDGTKRVRGTSAEDSWLVKIDSIGDSLGLSLKALKRREDVFELVKTAMLKQNAATSHGDQREIEGVAEHTTQEILGLFDGR